jgi:nucleotide-binding universal stress UspA family protein
MASRATADGGRIVLVGYDGSPNAAGAIEIGARLLPDAAARIVSLWTPSFGDRAARHRLTRTTRSVDELQRVIEAEGEAAGEQRAAEGVELARSAGWSEATTLTRRSFGSEGIELAQLAEEIGPAALVVGSRGLSGVRAALGSVSDFAVHWSRVPVLVVPHPLPAADRQATADGPVLVAHDGSAGAERALGAARELFTGRPLVVAGVGEEPPAAEGAELVRLDAIGVRDSARAVADALALHATDRGAAVIVVGSRGRSASREILLGSVAMATLHHAHRPVLVVPDPRHFER